MKNERADHTLSPTAVVHEAVIRLLRDTDFEASDRGYLLASASRAMREVLVDHARRRAADRRGAGWRRVSLDSVLDYFEEQNLDVLAVHEALDRLARMNHRQSQIMTLRYFGGLTVPEIASALGRFGGHRGEGLAVGTSLASRPTPSGGAEWDRNGGFRLTICFDAALRLNPSDREAWLRRACGGDDELRIEVSRLLDQDEGAERDGFLALHGAPARPLDETASWPPRKAEPSERLATSRSITPESGSTETPGHRNRERRSPWARGHTRYPRPNRWCVRGCVSYR